jgi:hypothetical protein
MEKEYPFVQLQYQGEGIQTQVNWRRSPPAILIQRLATTSSLSGSQDRSKIHMDILCRGCTETTESEKCKYEGKFETCHNACRFRFSSSNPC